MHSLFHYLKRAPGTAGRRQTRNAARWLAAGLLAGVTSLAPATTLTFDNGFGSLLAPGDSVFDSGWRLTAEGPGAGLVGAVLDGDDAYVCSNMVCPYNPVGNYYAAVNDGSVRLEMGGAGAGGAFRLADFSASFIGTSYDTEYVGLVGMLLLVGRDASGSTQQESYSLYGDFTLGFAPYATSAAFASHDFTSITLTAFGCNAAGICSTANNQAQFALDTINVNASVSAVPEPATYVFLLAGLATVLVLARRRHLPSLTGRTL